MQIRDLFGQEYQKEPKEERKKQKKEIRKWKEIGKKGMEDL